MEVSTADSVITFGIQKVDEPFMSFESLLVMLILSVSTEKYIVRIVVFKGIKIFSVG